MLRNNQVQAIQNSLLNEFDSPKGGFDKRFLEIINKWKTVAESEASHNDNSKSS